MCTLRKKIAMRKLETNNELADLKAGSISLPLVSYPSKTTSPSPDTLERWRDSKSPIEFKAWQHKADQLSDPITPLKLDTIRQLSERWQSQHKSEHLLKSIQNHLIALLLTFESECPESNKGTSINAVETILNSVSDFKFSSTKATVDTELDVLINSLSTIKTDLEQLNPQQFQQTITCIQQALTQIQSTQTKSNECQTLLF